MVVPDLTMGFDLETLALVAAGIVFGILALRYLVAYLNSDGDDRLSEAANRTARWLGMVVGGFLFTVGVGLTQGADVIAMFTQFLGEHFFLASNLGGIGLGWLALSGRIALTPDQYVGIAMFLAAATYFLNEVYDLA